MPQFHAVVPTPRASRNMTRLCKHFAHKGDVRFDETHAQINFTFGACRMYAESDRLLIDCQAEAGEATKRLRFVIADHLGRFSGDEALEVEWQEGPLQESPDQMTP